MILKQTNSLSDVEITSTTAPAFSQFEITRPAVKLDDPRAESLGFVPAHQAERISVFNRNSVPRSQPGVVRLAEKYSDLLGMRTLRMNRKPERHRKTVVEQTAPAIASL